MRRSLILAMAASLTFAAGATVYLASSASAATACAPEWSATAVYVGGNSSSQSGHNYTAKWWTQNESPATHSGQWDVWADNGACAGGTTPTTPPASPTTRPPTTPPTTPPTQNPGGSGKNVVGYFAEWGVYQRAYFVKNLVSSGSAAKMTHLLYAFGNTTGGQCSIGDSYADYDMAYTAANSVDGVADTWDAGALRGS